MCAFGTEISGVYYSRINHDWPLRGTNLSLTRKEEALKHGAGTQAAPFVRRWKNTAATAAFPLWHPAASMALPQRYTGSGIMVEHGAGESSRPAPAATGKAPGSGLNFRGYRSRPI
jgi:hypothetical protein